MFRQRSAMGTVTVAAVVIIVLIVGAVGYVVFTSNQGSRQTGSSTSGGTLTTPTSTATSAVGTSTTTETISISTATSNESAPTLSSVALSNVTINGSPGEIGVDANRSRIYVADLFANTLTVVDGSTHAILKEITLPGTAVGLGMAFDEKNGTLYIPVLGCVNEVDAANSCSSGSGAGEGEVVEVDESTETVVGSVSVEVGALVIDQSNGMLYGTEGTSGPVGQAGFLVAINSLGSVIGNLSLGAYPIGLAMDAQSDTVWVAECATSGVSCTSSVVGVSGAPQFGRVKVTASLPFDALNFGVAVDEASDTVYTLGLTASNLTLAAIYGANGTIRYLSPVGSSCAGAGGGALAVDPSTGVVYAASASGLFFLYLDGETGSTISLANETLGAQGVAINPATYQPIVTLGGSPHQDLGYLVFLPEVPSQFYVDASYLQRGVCLP